MAKRKAGRPKADEVNPTETVRVAEDLGQMLRWVALVQSRKTSDILDPLIRPAVVEMFGRLLPVIGPLHAAAVAAAKEHGKAPPPPLPPVAAHTLPAAKKK